MKNEREGKSQYLVERHTWKRRSFIRESENVVKGSEDNGKRTGNPVYSVGSITNGGGNTVNGGKYNITGEETTINGYQNTVIREKGCCHRGIDCSNN